MGAACALLGSCSKDTLPLPGKPATVSVVMSEYRFDHAPLVGRGRVVIDVRNEGRRDHEVSLVPLPPDFPPIARQLRSETRRPLPAMANVSRQPGERRVFAVDLRPGRYALLCFLREGDGVTHALKGMASELRVQ